MKKIVLFMIFILVSTVLLEADMVKVINVMGKAQYRKLSDSQWQDVQFNLKLKQGYRIRVGKESKVVLLLKDGSKVTLQNLCVFDISKLFENDKKKQSVFKVYYGKVNAQINKLLRNDDQFDIMTPTAVAGVRGTEFAVSVGRNLKTKVAVFKGEVAVKNVKMTDRDPIIVKESEITVVQKGKEPEAPQKLEFKTFDDWVEKLEAETDPIDEKDIIEW